jgi:galactokinase
MAINGMSEKKKQVIKQFTNLFGEPECIIRSPGRANIIGEHVDYCGGLVLPFAIQQSMYFCLRSNNTKVINFHSVDYDETYIIKEGKLHYAKEWCNYLNELIKILNQRGHRVNGIDIAFGSDIPIGGGVSSSSALCCGLLLLLNQKFKLNLSINEMIELASGIEHGIGLKGGKMDQTTILVGKKGYALLLDCETKEYTYIDLKLEDHFFMLFDTNVKHTLVDSEYNIRRKQVEGALKLIRKEYGADRTFRNTTLDQIKFIKDSHPVNYKRIRHVLKEIKRVEEAIFSIKNQDAITLGQLMSLSHSSLTADYEVSCKQLDYLAEKLQFHDQVLGARMMGGGFGGNVIALMTNELSSDQITELKEAYRNNFGYDFSMMKILPSDGVAMV